MSCNHTSSLNFEDLLSCAKKTAQETGLHALRQSHRRHEVVQSFAHDVKLKLDFECQEIAEDIIRSRFPDHGILGEESVAPPTETKFLWIIDPIDGTVNFFHGLPLWCCSIAVQNEGKLIAGAVYAPVMEECYTACVGKPALCNEKQIAVSEIQRLDQAIISTGLHKNNKNLPESIKLFTRMAMKTQKLRVMGSSALDICHVASGKADGYYESSIYLWDVAAGSVIVKQAGGHSEILESYDGNRMRFMATNGHLHESLKQTLTPVPETLLSHKGTE